MMTSRFGERLLPLLLRFGEPLDQMAASDLRLSRVDRKGVLLKDTSHSVATVWSELGKTRVTLIGRETTDDE